MVRTCALIVFGYLFVVCCCFLFVEVCLCFLFVVSVGAFVPYVPACSVCVFFRCRFDTCLCSLVAVLVGTERSDSSLHVFFVTQFVSSFLSYGERFVLSFCFAAKPCSSCFLGDTICLSISFFLIGACVLLLPLRSVLVFASCRVGRCLSSPVAVLVGACGRQLPFWSD